MTWVKLRNCNARYSNVYEGITGIITEYGEIYDYESNHKFMVLVSYSSIVAIYDNDNDTLFLMPRWDYSITTQSHIRKWCEDILHCRIYKKDIINGEFCGMAITKCVGFQFMNRERIYRY